MATQQKGVKDKLFFKYCSAFANLYGRLPVRDAFDIIDQHNPEKYTFDDFVSYLEAYQRRRDHCDVKPEGFFFVFDPYDTDDWPNKEIISDCYETDCYSDPSDENEYDILVHEQSGKPLYVPSKEELLKYADDHYYARSPELTAVIDFVLKNKVKLPFSLTAHDIAAEVGLPLIMESNATEAVQLLIKWLKVPKNTDEQVRFLSELTELVLALSDNTRMWFLRGHTPNEMSELVVTNTICLEP